jgi:hypothetical protein
MKIVKNTEGGAFEFQLSKSLKLLESWGYSVLNDFTGFATAAFTA